MLVYQRVLMITKWQRCANGCSSSHPHGNSQVILAVGSQGLGWKRWENHHRGSSDVAWKPGSWHRCVFSDGYHGGWIHKRNTPNNTGWFEVCVCEVWIVLMLCSTGCAGSSPKCQGHDVAALYLVAKLYWLNHRLAWLCCCEVPWDQMALESSLG